MPSSATQASAPDSSGSRQLELAGAWPRALNGAGEASALQPPDALLLAWLIVEGPTPRERLAQLLWPNSEPHTARNALRQRLFRLRRQCGVQVVTGTDVLALAPGIEHDLAGSVALLGTLRAAGCPELEDWLITHRQQRLAVARRATELQIEMLEQQGDAAQALPLAMSLVDADPTSEDAHRRLMRLHYLRGDRAAAVQAFDRCEQLLKHEIGTTPSQRTLELLALIERSAPLADAPAARDAMPAAVLRPPRLVAREAELAQLQRAVAGTVPQGVVLVTGEAGMGKSRLIQALAAQRAALVHAAGRPGDHLVPFATLARALRAVLACNPAAVGTELRSQLAPLLPELAHGAAPAHLKEPLALAVQTLFCTMHRHCQVLVLDDLHFADDASLEVLGSLVGAVQDSTAPAPHWLLGLRPPAAGSRLHGLVALLEQAGPLTRVCLKPLDPAQMTEWVDAMGIPGVKGAAWGSMLHKQSAGNPLFALESLKLAWSEGTLGPVATGSPAVPGLPRPQSLAQLISQQLARLSPDALALGRVAAVAGVDFSIPLAEVVLARNAAELTDAWAELEAQQILRGHAFAHDLIHDAVLQGLPQVIARYLHGQVAAWLEAENGEPARVAAHWEAAGQASRALPALRQAADLAHRALREEETLAFLMRAVEISEADGHAGQAFTLLRRAVATHMNTVRQRRGMPLLDRLDRLARTAEQKALAAADRNWYATVMGDIDTATSTSANVLALLPAISDESIAAPIRQRLGTALGLAGRFDDALPLLRSVEAWVEAHGTADEHGEFHGNLAALLDNLGRTAEARRHHERALEASIRAGHHTGRVTHLANFAQSLLDAGNVPGAAEQLEQAQQIIDAFEMKGSSAGFVAVLMAQCERGQGRYAAAMTWCERADTLLAEANRARLPIVALARAHVWFDLAQHARVLQLLDGPALEAARKLPPRHAVRWRVLLARTRERLGQDPGSLLDEALAAAPEVGWPELGLIVRTEQARGLPPARALDQLALVAGGAHALSLHGAALGAHLNAAWLGAHAGPDGIARAVQHADAACATDGATHALNVDPALRWLAPAAAYSAAGLDGRASELLAQGQQWLQATVEQGVPMECVHTFLHQHHSNRALASGWVRAASESGGNPGKNHVIPPV
jgi:DNA-binding SARP family transcriptional activator